MPVGIDSSQTEFDTAEETGGAKTHTLSIDEMPSHTHTSSKLGRDGTLGGYLDQSNNLSESSASDILNNTGGGSAHNNMPPYIVVYMWKRTG